MRRRIIFAIVYTLVFTIPVIAALRVILSRPGEWQNTVDMLRGDYRWPIFPIALFWPWAVVAYSLMRRKKHA